MAIDYGYFAKRFEKFKTIYVLFSSVTRMPFVECDEETFDDQVYVFTSEARSKEVAERYVGEKNAMMVGQVPSEGIPSFLKSLYGLGVNAVMLEDEGAPVRLDLEILAEKPDLNELENGQIPKWNPGAQLAGLYFMQELSRPVERNKEEQKALRDMEEELAVNLMRSKLILAIDVTNTPGGYRSGRKGQKIQIPYISNSKGENFQPVYTDLGEFRKQYRSANGKKMRLTVATWDQLPGHLMAKAKGFVFNPAGYHLFLTKEQMESMKARYGASEENEE